MADSSACAPASAAVAFSIAHSASRLVIGAADGSEILRRMTRTAEPFEGRLSECLYRCGELG
jgi:hypothetical protein